MRKDQIEEAHMLLKQLSVLSHIKLVCETSDADITLTAQKSLNIPGFQYTMNIKDGINLVLPTVFDEKINVIKNRLIELGVDLHNDV